MPASIAIVGPGRLGQALGRRWSEGGLTLMGFVGRRAEAAQAAVEFCGAGRVLSTTDLADATVVLLAVGDSELVTATAAAAAERLPRRCSLWLHGSGFHGLEVLAPLRLLGARTGSLHPLCPLADAARGYAALPGKPAVLQGHEASLRLLHVLARKAGLRPLVMHDGDRVLYHAACALAANGVTALHDLLSTLFGQSGLVAPVVVDALLRGALDACAEHGAVAALSGPVLRGDVAVVAAHLRALQSMPGVAGNAYRTLMLQALWMAEQRGLDQRTAAALRSLLEQ